MQNRADFPALALAAPVGMVKARHAGDTLFLFAAFALTDERHPDDQEHREAHDRK